MIKARYSKNRFIPNTIFSAPKLVIFVEGPVSIKDAALPTLMPSNSQLCNSGIVPPPHAQSGTPIVAAIKTPNPFHVPQRRHSSLQI